MTYKELKLQIKNQQKELALKIRRGKALRKQKNQTNQTAEERSFYGIATDNIWYKTKNLSSDYRTIHIAYCMFFNKTPLELIENTTRPDNKMESKWYNSIIQNWETILSEETVCVNSD